MEYFDNIFCFRAHISFHWQYIFGIQCEKCTEQPKHNIYTHEIIIIKDDRMSQWYQLRRTIWLINCIFARCDFNKPKNSPFQRMENFQFPIHFFFHIYLLFIFCLCASIFGKYSNAKCKLTRHIDFMFIFIFEFIWFHIERTAAVTFFYWSLNVFDFHNLPQFFFFYHFIGAQQVLINIEAELGAGGTTLRKLTAFELYASFVAQQASAHKNEKRSRQKGTETEQKKIK